MERAEFDVLWYRGEYATTNEMADFHRFRFCIALLKLEEAEYLEDPSKLELAKMAYKRRTQDALDGGIAKELGNIVDAWQKLAYQERINNAKHGNKVRK